ncbi:HlyD family secretion protein [Spirosoma lituiforme]
MKDKVLEVSTENDVYVEHIEKKYDKSFKLLIKVNSIVVLIITIVIAYFGIIISYPDVVSGEMIVRSNIKPQPIVPIVDSKISRQVKFDGDNVNVNDIIFYLETLADYDEVESLKTWLSSLTDLLAKNNFLDYKYNTKYVKNLGELQQNYETFYMNYNLIKANINENSYINRIKILNDELEEFRKLDSSLNQQKLYLVSDLKLSKEEYDAYVMLEKDKVASKFELNSYESRYISKRNSIEQLNTSIIANRLNISNKQKELYDFKASINEKRLLLLELIGKLKSDIVTWESTHTIVAPISGVIRMTKSINVGDIITRSKNYVYIVNDTGGYEGELLVAQDNFGKIQINQLVLIKVNSYPSHEYGSVTGVVNQISYVANADEKKFLVLVKIPSSGETSYGKKIVLRNGMTATADVITIRSNFFQRVFYSYRKMLRQ